MAELDGRWSGTVRAVQLDGPASVAWSTEQRSSWSKQVDEGALSSNVCQILPTLSCHRNNIIIIEVYQPHPGSSLLMRATLNRCSRKVCTWRRHGVSCTRWAPALGLGLLLRPVVIRVVHLATRCSRVVRHVWLLRVARAADSVRLRRGLPCCSRHRVGVIVQEAERMRHFFLQAKYHKVSSPCTNLSLHLISMTVVMVRSPCANLSLHLLSMTVVMVRSSSRFSQVPR